MKRNLLFIILVLTAAEQMFVQSGCANIIPPQGGDRDTLAPIIIKAVPRDSTKNFKGDHINFTFDEYIDLQDQSSIIVSPVPKKIVKFLPKLNTISVRLSDTLKPNTTYTINFGNSIKDINEGNVAKQLTYIFSTGDYIDSLELSGKIILAETGKTDSTLVAMLYDDPTDSALINGSPAYVTRLDKNGKFRFRNLPPKRFYLYALKADPGNYRYLDNRTLFGFADKPIDIRQKNDSVMLYAYASDAPTTNTPPPHTSVNPSLNRGKPTSSAADRRLKFSTNLINDQQDLLSKFIVSFEQPLRLFDSSKIKLYTDSIFTPVPNYHFEKDSTNKKITLVTEWKENTLYRLIVDKDFADDSSNHKLLKTDTLSFTTKKLADYGSLKLKFRNLDLSKNPVLLFITNDNIFRSHPLTGTEFAVDLFLPGEYELRILYDTNKNGIWDPGDFFEKHQQPEIVKPVDRRILVKSNWQNEFEITP